MFIPSVQTPSAFAYEFPDRSGDWFLVRLPKPRSSDTQLLEIAEKFATEHRDLVHDAQSLLVVDFASNRECPEVYVKLRTPIPNE